MGVCNTDGVAPQESHGRTFGRTRIQLRGPGRTVLCEALTAIVPGFPGILIELQQNTLSSGTRARSARALDPDGFGPADGF